MLKFTHFFHFQWTCLRFQGFWGTVSDKNFCCKKKKVYHQKHKTFTGHSSAQNFVKKFENRTKFKIKSGYYLEILLPETMKLFGSRGKSITKDKNGRYISNLEITEVVLVHCNLSNNTNQHDSQVLQTFIPNTSFGQLFEISPTKK